MRSRCIYIYMCVIIIWSVALSVLDQPSPITIVAEYLFVYCSFVVVVVVWVLLLEGVVFFWVGAFWLLLSLVVFVFVLFLFFVVVIIIIIIIIIFFFYFFFFLGGGGVWAFWLFCWVVSLRVLLCFTLFFARCI